MAGNKDAFYSQLKQLGVLMTVPMILLAGPVIGFLLGGWVDHKIRVYPWFTIFFIALGFIASAREVARLLRQISKEDKEK